jgi:hypothetical protein
MRNWAAAGLDYLCPKDRRDERLGDLGTWLRAGIRTRGFPADAGVRPADFRPIMLPLPQRTAFRCEWRQAEDRGSDRHEHRTQKDDPVCRFGGDEREALTESVRTRIRRG